MNQTRSGHGHRCIVHRQTRPGILGLLTGGRFTDKGSYPQGLSPKNSSDSVFFGREGAACRLHRPDSTDGSDAQINGGVAA